MAWKRILVGWQGVFRAVVLELLPVRELAEHFSPDTGCPTKELPSMAGLVFLSDFLDWNAVDAADAYSLLKKGGRSSCRAVRVWKVACFLRLGRSLALPANVIQQAAKL